MRKSTTAFVSPEGSRDEAHALSPVPYLAGELISTHQSLALMRASYAHNMRLTGRRYTGRAVRL
jgi:hypothetical protein